MGDNAMTVVDVDHDAAPVLVFEHFMRAKYAPLDVPLSGDLDVEVARVVVTPGELSESEPTAFQIIIGDGQITMPLRYTAQSADVRCHVLASSLDEVVEEIQTFRSTNTFPKIPSHHARDLGICVDLVTEYQVLAQEHSQSWVKVLHGPLTFRCPQSPVGGVLWREIPSKERIPTVAAQRWQQGIQYRRGDVVYMNDPSGTTRLYVAACDIAPGEMSPVDAVAQQANVPPPAPGTAPAAPGNPPAPVPAGP